VDGSNRMVDLGGRSAERKRGEHETEHHGPAKAGRTARIKVNMGQVMYPLENPAAAYANMYSHLRLNVA